MRRLRRALAALLLPLSAVPVVLAVPEIAETYSNYERNHAAGPLAAPPIRLSADARGLAPLPAHPGSVPVLVYRGVGNGEGLVTRAELGRQLALLRHLGYRSISARQYADFRQGRDAGLPERPLLVTFERGLLSTYRQADQVLKATGTRATMFVETAEVQRKPDSQLRWNELKDMQASGRWDIQTYGHEAGRPVTVDSDGRSAPFYAGLRYTKSFGRETLPDFEQRATLDIFRAKAMLREHGIRAELFALPDADYSAKATNDERTLGLVSKLVERQFAAYFESADRDPEFSGPTGPAGRLLVDEKLDSAGLYRWLKERNPKREPKRKRRK